MDKNELYSKFKIDAIRIGRLTLIIALVMALFPGIYLALFKGVWPGFPMIWKAFAPILVSLFMLWIIEPPSYFPILGLTGTFVSWLSGNILNLRIPCSVVCQQVAGVEEGTPEGDAISTIGLCVSVFVNIVIVLVFSVAGLQILGIMPEALKEGFNYLLPAITGAMMVSFAVRNWKVCIIALLITFISRFFNVNTVIDLAVVVFPTIIVAVIMYRKKWIQ